MDRIKKLEIISGEPNPQQRLALLVENEFKDEATKLIQDALQTNTAILYYDWHSTDHCKPLPRWSQSDSQSGTFVVIHSGTDLDRDQGNKDRHAWEICFELGWEQEALDWSDEQSRQLIEAIFSQSLVRPLNQWSFRQAQGNGEVVWRMLSPDESEIGRETAALFLVYQLREADFGRIRQWIEHVPGFDSEEHAYKGGRVGYDDVKLINWLVDKLMSLGWTDNRIRKELLEWIWLKKGTWPQWLLAVAKAKVFSSDDPALVCALRAWLRRSSWLTETVPQRDDKEQSKDVYAELFKLAQWDAVQGEYFAGVLADLIVNRYHSNAKWLVDNLCSAMGLGDDSKVAWPKVTKLAGEKFMAKGEVGRFVALADRYDLTVTDETREIARTRKMAVNLDRY